MSNRSIPEIRAAAARQAEIVRRLAAEEESLHKGGRRHRHRTFLDVIAGLVPHRQAGSAAFHRP